MGREVTFIIPEGDYCHKEGVVCPLWIFRAATPFCWAKKIVLEEEIHTGIIKKPKDSKGNYICEED